MERKVKARLPEENVEYTFICPDRIARTYVYVGLSDNGRVILQNIKTKRFTNMTPGWFAKMKKNQCIAINRPSKIDADVKKIAETITASVEQLTFEQKVINELRTLSPAMAHSVFSAIKYHPSTLADELERLYTGEKDTYSQDYVNRVCGNMMKALDIIHPASEGSPF